MSDLPAATLVALLIEHRLTIVTAESCTGGLVAGAITDVPGASAAFYGGFVTYANEAKSRMIGVAARMIRDYGAVSTQVARAMADGARNTARTDIAIAITGIAGPDGGSDKKPVGLVYIACSTADGTEVQEHRFGPLTRDEIRAKTVTAALALAESVVTQAHAPAEQKQQASPLASKP